MNKIISIITALILSSSTFDADAYRLIDAVGINYRLFRQRGGND